jgi:hypothetical protein
MVAHQLGAVLGQQVSELEIPGEYAQRACAK